MDFTTWVYQVTSLWIWIGDKLYFWWKPLLLMIVIQMALAENISRLKDLKRPAAQGFFWWIVLCYMTNGNAVG